MQLKVLSLLALVLIFMLLEDVDAHRRRRYYRRKSYGRKRPRYTRCFSEQNCINSRFGPCCSRGVAVEEGVARFALRGFCTPVSEALNAEEFTLNVLDLDAEADPGAALEAAAVGPPPAAKLLICPAGSLSQERRRKRSIGVGTEFILPFTLSPDVALAFPFVATTEPPTTGSGEEPTTAEPTEPATTTEGLSTIINTVIGPDLEGR